MCCSRIFRKLSIVMAMGIFGILTISLGGCQNSHEGPWPVVRCVALSPDGKSIAAATTYLDETITGEVVLFDLATGNRINTFTGFNDWLMSIAYSPDGKTVATGSYDQGLGLWDLSTGKLNPGFGRQAERVTSVCFSPDGSTVVSGDLSGEIVFWDVAKGSRKFSVVHGESDNFRGINCVAYSPDGKFLVSAGMGTVRMWNAENGKEVACLKGHDPYQVQGVTFSHDGKFIATSSIDSLIKIWDTENLREVNSIENSDVVYSVAFSPDDKTLVIGSGDHEVSLWDPATGQKLGTLEGHTNAVYDVKFSVNGKLLVSGSHDQTVRVWDVSTLKPLEVLRPLPSK